MTKNLAGGLKINLDSSNTENSVPFVSIITITLNDLNGLSKTFESIQKQTYRNYEIIIIDGNSSDGTIDYLKSNSNKIDIWLSGEDKSLYDAMNKGIKFASGEWLIFMNSDDIFFNDKVLENINNPKLITYDLIYGHCERDYKNFKKIWYAGKLTELWKGMVFSHQSVFIRTKIAKELLHNLDFPIAADYDFIYKCYLKKCTFYNLNEIVSKVTMGGISDINRIKSLKDRYAVHKQYPFKFKIWLFYKISSIVEFLKMLTKKILPEKVVDRITAGL